MAAGAPGGDAIYTAVLTVHSLLRWAALVFALAAMVPPWVGWLRGAGEERNRLTGTLLVATLDAQLLAGVLLYFALSPVTRAALAHASQIRRDPASSYWALAHPLLGVAGIALAHFGQALSKRAPDARSADRRAAVFFGAAALALAAATPWPFLAVGRALWPY